MQLPRLLRTTPFRLTLLFLALFAGAASAFLAYIYIATAGEVARSSESHVSHEVAALEHIYRDGGVAALNHAVIERSSIEGPMLYLLMTSAGAPISGSIGASPIGSLTDDHQWVRFTLAQPTETGGMAHRPARGEEVRLSGGERLFVGADIGESESYVARILRAVWGAGALILVLGLGGGVLISRDFNRNIANLKSVIDAARGGDMAARAPVRGTGDEYDDLAISLNDMLERLEKSMSGLRHAGDAIAHDLRSPLTRLRARLEAAVIDAEAGRIDARAALSHTLGRRRPGARHLQHRALDREAGSRRGAAGRGDLRRRGPRRQRGRTLRARSARRRASPSISRPRPGLALSASRDFVAQALANLIDNAVKYTPSGGGIRLRTRRRSSGDVEFSVTDTGPGIHRSRSWPAWPSGSCAWRTAATPPERRPWPLPRRRRRPRPWRKAGAGRGTRSRSRAADLVFAPPSSSRREARRR